MEKLSLDLISSKNFKNLQIQDGVELKNLNIFIGPNCSGKSNFISILQFLKNCIYGGTETEQISKFENAVAQSGGSNALDKSLTPPSDISFSYGFAPTEEIPNGLNLDLKLFVGAKDSKVTINYESLSDSKKKKNDPFCYYKVHDQEIGTGVIGFFNSPGEKPMSFENVSKISNNKLVLGSVAPNNAILDDIANWHFYNSNNMDLDKIKNAEPKIGPSDIYLSKSGDNLALVVENLIQQNIDFEDSLNAAMRSILPTTRRLRPARTGLRSINLQWFFEGHEDALYLNELSDGAVRMLCLATMLLSPHLPALLVIDEPELGIHVSWMPVLAEWIKAASEKTQVIISTHSPDLLDHFTDQLENVFCFSSEDKNHFTMKNLSKNKLEASLNEGWQLGDLYRVGDPAVGGWPW